MLIYCNKWMGVVVLLLFFSCQLSNNNQPVRKGISKKAYQSGAIINITATQLNSLIKNDHCCLPLRPSKQKSKQVFESTGAYGL